MTVAQLRRAGWTVTKAGRSFYVLKTPKGEAIEIDYSSEQPGSDKWIVDLIDRRDGYATRTLSDALETVAETIR